VEYVVMSPNILFEHPDKSVWTFSSGCGNGPKIFLCSKHRLTKTTATVQAKEHPRHFKSQLQVVLFCIESLF
jgi:hypothetical protein